ncbi:MAG TPA: tetratricopeptide repeat protein [Sediminibacterium sp.]|nr:tetratricopeptide repeat protein [Sediminibacterium sp.]
MLILLLAACHTDKQAPPAQAKNGTTPLPAALQVLSAAVHQHPDSTALRWQYLNALDSIGLHREALQEVNKLLLHDSLNFECWYRKGDIQQVLGDTSGALQSYRYAIRIYPSPDAMLSAANLFAEKKNPLALRICDQLVQEKPGREYLAHCAFITGVYYARTGQRQAANAAFDKCLMNDLYYAEAYMEKGFLLTDAGNYAAALKVFQTLVTLKNNYADGYYWVAKCQEKLQHQAAAIAAYRQSLALDPGLREAGIALQRLGANEK